MRRIFFFLGSPGRRAERSLALTDLFPVLRVLGMLMCLFAVAMLATTEPDLVARLDDFRARQTAKAAAPISAEATVMRAKVEKMRAPSTPCRTRDSIHSSTPALSSAAIEVPSARPR